MAIQYFFRSAGGKNPVMRHSMDIAEEAFINCLAG